MPLLYLFLKFKGGGNNLQYDIVRMVILFSSYRLIQHCSEWNPFEKKHVYWDITDNTTWVWRVTYPNLPFAYYSVAAFIQMVKKDAQVSQILEQKIFIRCLGCHHYIQKMRAKIEVSSLIIGRSCLTGSLILLESGFEDASTHMPLWVYCCYLEKFRVLAG